MTDLKSKISNLKHTLDNLIFLKTEINTAIKLVYKTLKNNKNIYICGNGGSAAQAQHLAAEFLVRLRPKVNRKPFAAISINTQKHHLNPPPYEKLSPPEDKPYLAFRLNIKSCLNKKSAPTFAEP